MATGFLDFSTYTAGVQPTGTTRRHVTSGNSWINTANAAADGTHPALTHANATSQRRALSIDALDSLSADMEFAFVFKTTTGSTGDARMMLRGSGSAGTETAYNLGVVNGLCRTSKYVAGTSTTIGSDVGFVTASNTRYRVRVRANGTGLSVKAWADGSAEPGTWQINGRTDSAITAAGWNGIFQFVINGTTTIDWLGWASAGDTAPLIEDMATAAGSGAGTLTWSGAAAGSAPSTPAIVHNIVGGLTSAGFKVTARTTGATSTRLAVSTSSGLTSPTYFGPVSPDGAGYAALTATGLTADTAYWWAVEVDGVLMSSVKGQARTLAAAGSQASFSFVAGSCVDTGRDNDVLDKIRTHTGPDGLPARFFAHLGDLHYWWRTSLANFRDMNASTFRAPYEAQIEQAKHHQLLRTIPIEHVWSDNDSWQSNTDGTDGYKVPAGVAQRQVFPSQTLPDSAAIYRSWVNGRVRFIITDERYYASALGSSDSSSKTKLGTTQKAWFKSEITAAATANQVVVWFGDGLWVGINTIDGTNDAWSAYPSERTELGTYIAASGVRLLRIHGDTHTLAADNGSHNSWGGFPYFDAAPIDRDANTWYSAGWGTPSAGTWPPSAQQAKTFGWFDVDDAGSTLTITGTLYSTESGTDTSRVALATTFDMVSEGSASGTVSWAGSAAGKRIPKGSATGSISWAGSATGKRVPKGTATGTLGWSGAAVGKRTPKAAATGTLAWAGTAAGKRTPKGTASGTLSWAGSAAGKRTPKASAAGTIAWAGSATGFAPVVGGASGFGAGTINWAGTASGVRTSRGTASGSLSWAGAAVGKRTPKATVAGTLTWLGTAVGQAPSIDTHSGTGAGTLTWLGTAAVVPPTQPTTPGHMTPGTATGPQMTPVPGTGVTMRPVLAATSSMSSR